MRWTPGGSSDDSGSGGMQFGGFHLGIGRLIIVFVLSLVFHRNFFALLGSGSGGAPVAVSQQHRAQESPATDAILFLRISRERVFQHPRLVSPVMLKRSGIAATPGIEFS